MRKKCFVVSIFILFVSVAVFAKPNPFTFSSDHLLVDSGGSSFEQMMSDTAFGGGFLYTVWVDIRTQQHIRFVKTQSGNSSGWTDISSPTTDIDHPKIACSPDGQEIVVLWQGKNSESYLHIYSAGSFDGGNTWFGPTRIDDGADTWDGMTPDIAYISTGSFVAAWESHQIPGNFDIHSDRTYDNGQNWSADVIASTGSLSDIWDNIDPAIATDDLGNVFVSHTTFNGSDRRILLNTSDDGGLIWNSEIGTFGTSVPSGKDMTESRIAAWGNGNIVISWLQDDIGFSGDSVCATFSPDGGSSFLAGGYLIVNEYATAFDETSHDLAVDGRGGICFVFISNRPIAHCYLAISFDRLQSILGDWRIDGGTSSQLIGNPSVAISPFGSVFTVFEKKQTGLNHIYGNQGIVSFQDSFDDDTFSGWTNRRGVSRSALFAWDDSGYSAEFTEDGSNIGITGKGSSRAAGLLDQVWPEIQQGNVTFYFYDGYGSDPNYATTDWTSSLEYDDGTKAGVVRALGVVNPSSKYSVDNGAKGWSETTIDRSEGWHFVRYEVDDEGIRIYLDEEDYPGDNPVYTDTTFTGFETLVFEGGSDAAPYYLDELICSVGNITDSVPATGPISLSILLLLLGALLGRKRQGR